MDCWMLFEQYYLLLDQARLLSEFCFPIREANPVFTKFDRENEPENFGTQMRKLDMRVALVWTDEQLVPGVAHDVFFAFPNDRTTVQMTFREEFWPIEIGVQCDSRDEQKALRERIVEMLDSVRSYEQCFEFCADMSLDRELKHLEELAVGSWLPLRPDIEAVEQEVFGKI